MQVSFNVAITLRALVPLMVNMDREKDSKKQSSDKTRPAQPCDGEKQQVKAPLKPLSKPSDKEK